MTTRLLAEIPLRTARDSGWSWRSVSASIGVADGAKDNRSFLSGQEVDGEIAGFHHATNHPSKASEHAASKDGWYGE